MKTTRTWTKRTMLAMFATALMAVGCNADQGDVGGPDTGAAKQSITRLGTWQEGCSVRTVFDLRSDRAIEIVALDAGEWATEDLQLALYEVNEEGEEIRLQTSAMTLRKLLQQSSASSARNEGLQEQSASSSYDSSSRSGRTSTASEMHNENAQSSSSSDETISEVVENESSLFHSVTSANTLNRVAASSAAAQDSARADQDSAADAASDSSDVDIDRSASLSDDEIDIDERESLSESSASSSQSASSSSDQASSMSQSERDELSEASGSDAQEILNTSDRSASTSSRSASDSMATSSSSESLVTTAEEEFSEVSENEATESSSHSLSDSAQADESMSLEELDQSEEMRDEMSSRTLVFNNLENLNSRHLRLEVIFQGSVDESNLDVFMGELEGEASQSVEMLDELFSESFVTSFDACTVEDASDVIGDLGDETIGR